MDLQQELTEQRNRRFEALLEPFYKDCQRWALHLTQNQADADDVLAEAIAAALVNIQSLKNDGAFKTWLFRIIANTYRMMLRRRKRPVDSVEHSAFDRVDSGQPDRYTQNEMGAALRQAMAALAPEQREALWLFHIEGLSSKQVSEILGKQEGAVRVMLTRARDRLKQQLVKMGLGDVM
jgi:RNA polymerase sigma-70 factor (ECF subfamily)